MVKAERASRRGIKTVKAEEASRGRGTASIADCLISRDCPTKTQELRCFKCSERGHVASKCIEQPRTAGVVDVQSTT